MTIPPSSLILVTVMNRKRDMEIARLLGWYRIPLRSAPKVVAVDHLAFYQTEVFGEEKWRIQYMAPVRGVELTTRRELLRDEIEHPRAKEEYYKVQIGPLAALPKPVLATKWKRITFFYTTGEYLLKANTIDELIVNSEERSLLWRSLRERVTQTQAYSVELPEVDVDPQILTLLLGFKGFEKRE